MEKTLDKITLARRKSFKIFFIGFNKTGTISLLHLFKLSLKYSCSFLESIIGDRSELKVKIIYTLIITIKKNKIY